MSINSKINLAAILIGVYGIFVLINALAYYFILLPGETDIFRAILRVVGTGILAYGLSKRNKLAYWVALMASCAWAGLGILWISLTSIFIGFNPGGVVNVILTFLLIVTFILLLPKETREQFK